MTANIRHLVRLSPAQIIAGGGQEDMDYMLDRPPFTRYFWSGSGFVAGGGLSTNSAGNLEDVTTHEVYALSELTPYVTLTASGIAFTGACELAGWYCSVAAGTIAIYDALSETGTPVVPATALAVGPMPIFGPGTTGKLALTTGCYVVLSDAATVRVLVGD